MLKKTLFCYFLMAAFSLPAFAQLQSWGEYPLVPRPAGVTNNRELSQIDPLRALQNLDDPQVQSWLRKQNDLSQQLLGRINGRDVLLNRLQALDIDSRVKKNVTAAPMLMKVVVPTALKKPTKPTHIELKITNALIYTQSGSDQRMRLIMRNESIGSERVLYVENLNEHLLRIVAAPDSKHLALMLEQSSGEVVIRTISVPDGEVSDDHIFCASADSMAEPSMIWSADSNALIYSQSVVASNLNRTDIWQHVIGQPQKMDKLILGAQAVSAFAKRLKMSSSDVPVISVLTGTPWILLSLSPSEGRADAGGSEKNDGNWRSYFYANQSEIKTTEIPWKNLAIRTDKVQSLKLDGGKIFLLSNKKAANGEILKLDVSKAGEKLQLSQFQELVKAGSSEIKDFAVGKEHLFWHSIATGNVRNSRLFKLDLTSGVSEEIKLPDVGMLTHLQVDYDTELLTFNLQPFNASTGTYTITTRGMVTVVTAPVPADVEVAKDVNPVQKKILMIPEADGRNVDVVLTYLSGTVIDGSRPLLLRIVSNKNADNEIGDMAWFEHGGLIATMSLHATDKQLTKRSDPANEVATVARYLVRQGYASPKKLVAEEMQAASNALIRAILREPELFAAVATYDVASEEILKNPLQSKPSDGKSRSGPSISGVSRSAYEELRAGVGYTAVLLSADNQNPTAPMWMSGKLAAGMQILSTNKSKPILLDTVRPGVAMSDELVRKANRWAFFLWQSGELKFSLQATGR